MALYNILNDLSRDEGILIRVTFLISFFHLASVLIKLIFMFYFVSSSSSKVWLYYKFNYVNISNAVLTYFICTYCFSLCFCSRVLSLYTVELGYNVMKGYFVSL